MPITYPGIVDTLSRQYDSDAVVILTIDAPLVTGLTFDDADISGEEITITAHGLTSFDEVVVSIGSGPITPPLVDQGNYSVDVVDTDTIRLAETAIDNRNSSYITFTPGTSTNMGIDEAGVTINTGIEYVVLKEVANANGYARQALPSPTYTIDKVTNQNVFTPDVTVSFSATGGNINFDKVVVLTNSSTTYGSSSGECNAVLEVSGTILAGAPAQDIFIRVSDARAPFGTPGSD